MTKFVIVLRPLIIQLNIAYMKGGDMMNKKEIERWLECRFTEIEVEEDYVDVRVDEYEREVTL